MMQGIAAPAAWAQKRVKHVAEFVTGWTPSTGNQAFFDGENLWANISDLGPRELVDTAKRISDEAVELAGMEQAPAGSLLFSFKLSIGQVSVAQRPMYTNEAIAAFPPQSGLNTRWAYYAFPHFIPQNANENIYGAKLLNQELIRSASLLVPPADAQERIANFLDEQTARIDALIAEKTELLSRLNEFAQSAIAAEVVGADVPGRRIATNVPEVPSIPAGWSLVPMMRLTDPARPIMYGIVLPGPNVEEGPSVPIVKGGDVRPHRLRLSLLNRTTPEVEAPFARARLSPGDIVYSIRGSIGDAELVPAELAGANITQDVARIAPRPGLCGSWLLYAAKSLPVFAQLEALCMGAAVKGINIFDLKRARVPTPPAGEQTKIAFRLQERLGRLEGLKAHSNEHIERLREYRSSLISAAVTGQLDLGALDAKKAA